MSDPELPEEMANNIFAAACPVRQVFDHVFSRWGLLVMARLTLGTARFGSLRRSIGGISEKMLSQTLKILEEEGLVIRREWDEKLPRVEYSLTEKGMRIALGIKALIEDLYRELGDRLGA